MTDANQTPAEPGTPPAIIGALFDFAEAECGHNPVAAHHALTTVEAWVANAKAENERLREALTWAAGFIRCNFPRASTQYPDMRNAEALVERRPVHTGEFQLTVARAEVAEAERDKLRAENAKLRARLKPLADLWDGPLGVGDRVRRHCESESARDYCRLHLWGSQADLTLGDSRRAAEMLAGKGEG